MLNQVVVIGRFVGDLEDDVLLDIDGVIVPLAINERLFSEIKSKVSPSTLVGIKGRLITHMKGVVVEVEKISYLEQANY